MRLAERYRPVQLSGIVGQRSVKVLQAFAIEPYPRCWILTGPGGVGKSCAAIALANELGAVDEWSGFTKVVAAKLGVDAATAQMDRLHLRCLAGEWNFLLIEELERLSPQCTGLLKDALASENLPRRAIVVATSNDTSGIDGALLQRFGKPLVFEGQGSLAQAGIARLQEIWGRECPGLEMPPGAASWGWRYEAGRKVEYSLRVALDALEQAVLLNRLECAA